MSAPNPFHFMRCRLNEDILLVIVSFMSMPALIAFSQINRTYAKWVITHLDLSLDKQLLDYVEDTEGFRSAMRLCGAVISGSFALQFARMNDQCNFSPGDLDIYLPRSFASRFCAYLVEVEGYSVVVTYRVPYGRNAAHEVVVQVERHGRRIDIMPSVTECALYPLSHFWGSHLLNFISADTFCVAYPELTFWGRSLLSPFQLVDHRYPSGAVVDLIRKYEARGFDFRVRPYAWAETHPIPPCAASPGCSRVRRFFGDRHCAVGTITRTRLNCGFHRWLPSRTTVAWWRGGDPCGMECDHGDWLPERREPAAAEIDAHSIPRRL